ncbi:MAG: hypothetical protein IK118_03465 [Clostridia bacterium]|nr:hypothetical protein [Clostridia bacterium]
MKAFFIRITALVAALCLLCALPAGNTAAYAAAGETAALTCRAADEWNALFDRRGKRAEGWLGADGIYTVPTSNGKTVFLFSDTLVGTSDKNGKTENAKMPNHTAAVLNGTQPYSSRMTFYYGTDGRRRDGWNLFGERFWLFDGVYLNDTLYILAFMPSQELKPLCVRLVSVPVRNGTPEFEKYGVGTDIPELCARSADGKYIYAFGQGITDCSAEDGFIYVYGFKDPLAGDESRNLIVSRIKAEDFGDFSRLTYWDGAGWSTDIETCADAAQNVGCEMSCTKIASGPLAGKYILVWMWATMSGRLAYAIGDAPWGPFSEPVFFYDAPEHGTPAANGTDTLYTYNAKAHPALSPDGELLISYNVNSSGEQYTTDYHPRFLYLTLDPDAAEKNGSASFATRLRAFLERIFVFFLRFSSKH